MVKVKKAIFVVAGFGTRFLPQTKAVPKEMMPIVDTPIVQYLVEEAVDAGIQEIIFVTGRGKSAIENHFDVSYELEHKLAMKGKTQLLEKVKKITSICNYAYVRQAEQNGDGDAILHAKPFIDLPEPVLIVFPDYIMPRSNNTFEKMIKYYHEHQKPIIASDRVPYNMVSQYGILDVKDLGYDKISKITRFVEKPKQQDAPSNLINNGYAIINADIWSLLEGVSSTTADGEIRLADAFTKYVDSGKDLMVLEPDKSGYDCGSKLGFLKATVDFGLERDDLKEEFMEFLKARVKK